jgi:hypothetical protein
LPQFRLGARKIACLQKVHSLISVRLRIIGLAGKLSQGERGAKQAHRDKPESPEAA